VTRTPVVTCFLHRKGHILLLRRSDRVGTYRGMWAGVSGYVERVPLEQAYVEIAEETGLSERAVRLEGIGPPTLVDDEEQARRWIVYPFVFTLRAGREVTTNWETTESRWIAPEAVGEQDTVPGLETVLRAVWPPFGSAQLWRAARRIAADRVSGSTRLAVEALRAWWRFPRTREAYAPDARLHAARALAALRPSMGVIAHALAVALMHPDAETGLEQTIADAATACAMLGAKHLLRARRVVTYSASSVCETALRTWHALSGNGEVIVAESRPRLEGTAAAERLAKAGLRVRLTTDAQIGLALREADALLVGADAITDDDHLLNKVGTEGAAMMARHLGVPAYALCQTHKIAPPGWPIALERQEPADVHAATELRVDNVAFDATPVERFTRVLTEHGPLTKRRLREVRAELAGSPLVQ
jgi:translation initiation factor 2B subunit (eIF-2B alpha/beta/delta family)